MGITKRTLRKSLLALILVLLMVYTCIVPLPEKRTDAAQPQKVTEVYLGYDVIDPTAAVWTNSTGKIVYFGHGTIANGNGNTTDDYGIPFNVLKKQGDTYLLDAHAALSAEGKETAPGTSRWDTSNIKNYLNNTFYGTNQFFSDAEKARIQNTPLAAAEYYYVKSQDKIYPTAPEGFSSQYITDYSDNEYVFSLSLKEYIDYYGCGETDINAYTVRAKSGAHHFIRSSTSSYIMSIYGNGMIADGAGNQFVRMAPAMNVTLDSSNVRFTKVANYAQSTTFSKIQETSSREWTLVLADGNESFSALNSSTPYVTTDIGGTVSISVSNVTTGANASTQISGMLVDATDTVLYYGKIAETSETSFDLKIPEGLTAGEYKLYVFSEKIAGTNWTGYASNMVSLPITVKNEHRVKVLADTATESSTSNLEQDSIADLASMEEIIISSKDNYFFEDDFADSVKYRLNTDEEYAVGTTSLFADCGLKLKVVDNSEIHISGTPTCSVEIKLPSAHKKYAVDVAMNGLESTYTYGDVVNFNPKVTVSLDGASLESPPDGVLNAGEIKYYSTNEKVASVDENTGAVTINSIGEFQIKAMISANALHPANKVISETILVNPRDLTELASVSFDGSNKYEYTSKEWKPILNVVYGKIILAENKDYILSFENEMIKVGKKVFRFEFIGNYIGSAQITGEITKARFVMPEKPYTIQGEKGDNNYYKDNVTLVPAKGYLVSKTKDGAYVTSLTYRESTKDAGIYLKDAITGAVSDRINIPDMKIDIESPSITGAEEGSVYYGEEVEIVIEDLALAKLMINDEIVKITGNKMTITLASNKGKESYTIYMMDEAGNEKTITLDVCDEWMKSGYIPENKTIRLSVNEFYKLLNVGNWKITGDDTVYPGGITFYVENDGEYVFQQQ